MYGTMKRLGITATDTASATLREALTEKPRVISQLEK